MRLRHARGTVCIQATRASMRVGSSSRGHPADAVIGVHEPSGRVYDRQDADAARPTTGATPVERTQNLRTRYLVSSAVLAGLVIITHTHAELVDRWDVGAGDQSATLQFDFLDGRTFAFDVHWTGSLTGRGAFDLIADDDTGRFAFTFDVISYSFGDFLVGVGVDDAYQYGEGSPPDWIDVWHYWTAESPGDAWNYASIGFSDRVLTDGARDGWVFGTFDAPAVIPAPGVAGLGIVAVLTRTRRRRRRTRAGRRTP